MNNDKEKFSILNKNIEKDVIDFQLYNIKKQLDDKKDVTKNELIQLYGGLKELFKPESLDTLENIERFHKSLKVNRKEFLLKEQKRLMEKKKEIEDEIMKLSGLDNL